MLTKIQNKYYFFHVLLKDSLIPTDLNAEKP